MVHNYGPKCIKRPENLLALLIHFSGIFLIWHSGSKKGSVQLIPGIDVT